MWYRGRKRRVMSFAKLRQRKIESLETILARRRRQDKKSDQLREDLKKRNLPGAFILGYDDAVRSTDPNNVNFDKAFDPSKPEEMAKRIINSFGDPKIQVQQYVEGVRAYVKAKKEGKDVSKPLDWLL